MTISSGAKVRSASAIAWSGSPSPTSPWALSPEARMAARDASSRSAAATRAPSSSETQCLSFVFSAGDDDEHLGLLSPSVLLQLGEQLGAGNRLVRHDEQPLLAGRAWRHDLLLTGSSSAPRDVSHQAAIAPVASRNTTNPNHLLITYATAISPK